MNLIKFIANRIEDARDNQLEKSPNTQLERFNSPEQQNNIQALNRYYDPQKGRISSWWQRIKSDSRSNLIQTLTHEQKLIIDQAAMLEDAAINSKKKRAEFQTFIAQHAALFIEIQVHIKLVKKAAKKGFTLDNWQEDKAKEADHKRTIEVIEAEHKNRLEILEKEISLEVLRSSREMELEVEKHRLMKQVDFEFENKMASLDTRMAEIQHLLPQHLINALHKQLSTIHFEYEQVKLLKNDEYKEREIKRVERNMKVLEKNIREREKNI